MMGGDVDGARRELEALNAEIAKLESLNNAYVENSAMIEHQATKALLAQQSVNAALPKTTQATGTNHTHGGGVVPRPPPSPSAGRVDGSAPPPPPRRMVQEAPTHPDPLLEESLVASLSGEGWPIDSAIAAVKATNAQSLVAAKNWLLHHQGGSGIRGVRSLRRLVSTAETNATELSPPNPPTRSAHQTSTPTTPRQQSSEGTTYRKSSLSSSSSLLARDAKEKTPVKQLQQTDLLSSGLPPTGGASSSIGSSPSISRETSATMLGGSTSSRTILPWLKSSPSKREGGTVSVRVRLLDGSVADLDRKFHPMDSMKTVMHELMREHPMEKQPRPSSLGFVVPVPRKTYSWDQLDLMSLEAAGVCPRAMLILHVQK